MKEEMQVCKGEVECKVAGRRLWRAGFEDAHNYLPKALPNAFMSVEYEGGVFQPGSFRSIYYHKNYAIQLSKEYNLKHLVEHTKEKIVHVDHDSLKVKFEGVEGGYLGVTATFYTYSIHLVEGAIPDTCVAHWSYEYKAITPKHHAVMRARLNEVVPLSLKGVEEYLLKNDQYQD